MKRLLRNASKDIKPVNSADNARGEKFDQRFDRLERKLDGLSERVSEISIDFTWKLFIYFMGQVMLVLAWLIF